MMRIVISFILLLFTVTIFSQPLKPKQLKIIKQTIAEQFGKISEQVFLDMSPKTLCIIEKDTFFNPDGYYYLFQLKGDSAIRLDLSSFHGASFFRTLFAWQNKLYQLGGYGFFATKNDLIYFEKNSREWLYQPTNGQVPPFINGITFINNNKIYSFNNIKAGNNAEKNTVDSNLYVLDLVKMHWEKLEIPDKKLIMDAGYTQTNDYFWYHNQVYSVIVNKKEMKYLVLENKKVGCSICFEVEYQLNNALYFKWPSSSLMDNSHCKINLDSLWTAHRSLCKSLVPQKKEVNIEQQQSQSTWYFLIILSAFGAGIFFWFKKVKKNAEIIPSQIVNEEEDVQITNTENTYLKIIELNKEILSMEELDIALEINHLTLESRKLRRYRYLTELNKLYPGFIVRTKDEQDKRKFLYIISKKS